MTFNIEQDGLVLYSFEDNSESMNDLFEKLAETLYIKEELTPDSRNWKQELLNKDSTTFSYHQLEAVRIVKGWDMEADKIKFRMCEIPS